MSFARGLYQRFRHLIHEFARFGIVGGIAFLVTWGLFNLLIHGGLGTFLANALATLIAAVVSFAGNRYWTFRHRERTGMTRETVLFFVLNGVGVLIQQACIEAARLAFGRHDTLTVNAAFLVGVVLATLFRWWSYRKWVWLAPQEPQQGAAQDVRPDEPRGPVPLRPAPGRHAAGLQGSGSYGAGQLAPATVPSAPYRATRADAPLPGRASGPVQQNRP